MSFAGINYLAVVFAAIAAFVIGALYYGLMSKPWMKAARLSPQGTGMNPVIFMTSFLAELVMAWVMAGVIGHLGSGEVTLWNGIISGAFVWLGFIATTLVVNQRYEGFGWDLTIIDGLHWLLVSLAMGGIIGFMGV